MKNSLISLQQYLRYLPADMDTPISLFMGMAQTEDAILLESAQVDGRWGRYSVLACHTALSLSCKNNTLALTIKDDRLSDLKSLEGMDFIQGLRELMARIEIIPPQISQIPQKAGQEIDLPSITRGIYGYVGYGMASLFSPKLQETMPVNEADCTLILPKTVLLFDHLYNRLCQLSLGEHAEIKSAKANSSLSQHTNELFYPQLSDKISTQPTAEGYKENVNTIKEMLRQGEAIQVVPSVRFSVPFEGDTFEVYRRMRRVNPSPYMFYMRLLDAEPCSLSLFGSSPEVMVRCTQGKIELSPIAGTRKRGKDELEDKALAEELLSDPKERAEHVMLVDLGRNDLGRVAKTKSISLDRYMQVERFSHVMHLTSNISAELEEQYDALDLLAATFPAGTVSGAPKIRAMEIIREIEGQSREAYAGCIGWLGLDKDHVNMDMGITIRSMWHKENVLNWQAGGGIVHDSDPELEWKEVYNKSAVMRLILQEDF